MNDDLTFVATHKLKARLQLDVPRFEPRAQSSPIANDGVQEVYVRQMDTVVLHPQVISAKWTKNNHLIADELMVTIGWQEGGVDPRLLKNARCGFWLWDSNEEDFDEYAHLRFTGIGVKAQRRLDESGWVVDLTFHDYTTLFIHNKPLKTSGMPNWTDTLRVIWDRICENTGWQDPANGKIISSVAALKGDNLVFELDQPEFEGRQLGFITNKRFLAIGKPHPKQGASSWDVWQWCIGSLGLISYIERDQCIVTDTTEYYDASNAPRALYGYNIHTLEEDVDSGITSKGILLKSFDPLTRRILEAFYPLPGDERLKVHRAAVGKKSDGGTAVTPNEQSGDYEEYNRYDITNQEALERAAEEAYHERSKQELAGSFHTSELKLVTKNGAYANIFDLRAGDAISIEMEPRVNRDILLSLGGTSARIRYLVDHCDYDPDVARLVAKNLDVEALASVVFHITSIEVDYGPDKFDVEIKFHNLITVRT